LHAIHKWQRHVPKLVTTYKMTLMYFLVKIHINNQSTLYKMNGIVLLFKVIKLTMVFWWSNWIQQGGAYNPIYCNEFVFMSWYESCDMATPNKSFCAILKDLACELWVCMHFKILGTSPAKQLSTVFNRVST
jgi:hypothetical protein